MLKKWLRKKLQNILYQEDAVNIPAPKSYGIGAQSSNSSGVDINGLRFTVMSANGGCIVQLSQYDRKTDRTTYATYLITDEEDVAVRVGQIVSLELLRS